MVSAGASGHVNAGRPFSRTGSFNDSSADATFTATVDYGDGTGPQPLDLNADQSFSLSHVYLDVGTWTVTVSVSDGLGGTGTGTLFATVFAPPVANAGGPYNMTFGGGLTLNASASFDPDGDPLTYSWTINGHMNAASGVSPTLSWSQLQALGVNSAVSFSVSVQVDDGDGSIIASAPVTVLVGRATAITSVTSSANPSGFGQSVTFTASVAFNGPGSPTGTVDFFDVSAGMDLGSVPLVNGAAALSTSALAIGDHTIVATYSGDANFLTSAGHTTQSVTPSGSLSGIVFEDFNDDGQVDFGEQGIAGVLITLAGIDDLGHAVSRSMQTDGDGAYIFLNLRPGSYTITETQPAAYVQGINSIGSAGGSLQATDRFFVQLAQGINGINYNYGERPPAGSAVRHGQTASIGFWNNKNGQALIKGLNGGGANGLGSTQLGNWLAATLPNIFGTTAGSSNLTGKNNAYVAALFQSDFLVKGVKLDAAVLATALSVYVTNATLDPNKLAAQYGFTVSGDGVGTATFNVGSNGDAFGVTNNTTMTVLDLLLATNGQAVNGLLYNGNATKRAKANSVYSALLQGGDIG